MRVQGDVLEDVQPSHVLVLDRHWICLEGINPYVSEFLYLLQEAHLFFKCLSDDDTDTDRVILGIFDLEFALFIFDLKKTWATFITVFDLHVILFAKFMQNWQIDAFIDFDNFILQRVLMILGLCCFQNDDDDLFKGDLSPIDLHMF